VLLRGIRTNSLRTRLAPFSDACSWLVFRAAITGRISHCALRKFDVRSPIRPPVFLELRELQDTQRTDPDIIAIRYRGPARRPSSTAKTRSHTLTPITASPSEPRLFSHSNNRHLKARHSDQTLRVQTGKSSVHVMAAHTMIGRSRERILCNTEHRELECRRSVYKVGSDFSDDPPVAFRCSVGMAEAAPLSSAPP
jgi:hypothetical protein